MFKRSDRIPPKPDTPRPVKPDTIRPVPVVAAETAGRAMPPGKQAYEARRAAKAGVSLDRWMADKQKRAQAEIEAARRARIKAEPVKRGFFKRLLDRAHKPL